jgi:Tfp pilus assembly protein PilO
VDELQRSVSLQKRLSDEEEKATGPADLKSQMDDLRTHLEELQRSVSLQTPPEDGRPADADPAGLADKLEKVEKDVRVVKHALRKHLASGADIESLRQSFEELRALLFAPQTLAPDDDGAPRVLVDLPQVSQVQLVFRTPDEE